MVLRHFYRRTRSSQRWGRSLLLPSFEKPINSPARCLVVRQHIFVCSGGINSHEEKVRAARVHGDRQSPHEDSTEKCKCLKLLDRDTPAEQKVKWSRR